MKFDELDRARSRQHQRKQPGGDLVVEDDPGKKRKAAEGVDGIGENGESSDSAASSRSSPTKPTRADAVADAVLSSASAAVPGAGGESSDLRTGRWSAEETAFCDRLILLFEQGRLPIPDGLKLNDFLTEMLRSKQARLTKKMKNAKLSSRQYRRTSGYIDNVEEAMKFSMLESSFFQSLRCDVERSELRFHMQKEWRELFSSYCVSAGIKLDANQWLASVEEVDRRASQQKDAARMQRRKEMMGYALSQDHQNPQRGVFIDPPAQDTSETATVQDAGIHPITLHHPQQHPSEPMPLDPENADRKRKLLRTSSSSRASAAVTVPQPRPLSSYTSPFIGKAIDFVQRRNMPFEHVDAWVPSQVPKMNEVVTRLCFAGCATAEVRVPESGVGPARLMSADDQFDLISFGLYSQKFSFDVGCGLPGRVYQSGIPSWEQGIANAPSNLFERNGGARQWGIQTVLGLPILSPTVGRIVVVFYSYFDRPRDDALVTRMIDELTKMMPSPKWKLVVDVGLPSEPVASSETDDPNETRVLIHELLSLIHYHTPSDKSSPLSEFLPGFSSLRLLLSGEFSASKRERDLLESALGFFRKYRAMGIFDKDAVWMTARDFMAVSKHESLSLPSGVEHTCPGLQSRVAHSQRLTSTAALSPQSPPMLDGTYPAHPPRQQAHVSTAVGNGSMALIAHSSAGLAAEGGSAAFTTTNESAEKSTWNASISARPSGPQRSHVVQSFHLSQTAQGEEGSELASGMLDLFPMGLSPALHPIVANDMSPDFISLGLSTSQLAALLQSENVRMSEDSSLQ